MKTVDRVVVIIAATIMGWGLGNMLGNVIPHAPSAVAAGLSGIVLGFGVGLLINALR